MAIIKTVVTWDHEQSDAQLEQGRIKAFEMASSGLTNGEINVTSKPGDFLTVKERLWVTETAAQQWVDWVKTLPNPPVSAVVVVE